MRKPRKGNCRTTCYEWGDTVGSKMLYIDGKVPLSLFIGFVSERMYHASMAHLCAKHGFRANISAPSQAMLWSCWIECSATAERLGSASCTVDVIQNLPFFVHTFYLARMRALRTYFSWTPLQDNTILWQQLHNVISGLYIRHLIFCLKMDG